MSDYPRVTSKSVSWEALIRLYEARPTVEVVYEFSNGVTKTEPFDPQGIGVYEDIDLYIEPEPEPEPEPPPSPPPGDMDL
jgi:hypothetical protein